MFDRIEEVEFHTDSEEIEGFPYVARITKIRVDNSGSFDVVEIISAEINSWILVQVLVVSVLIDRFGKSEDGRWKMAKSPFTDNTTIHFSDPNDFMIFKLMFA